MAEYTRILLRQGPDIERNTVVLKSGEPAWVTDYKRLVIGDGSAYGGVSIGSQFLGFVTFDDISTLVNDVAPGYPGDFIFETNTNLLYVLSGSETILGKKAYQIKTNYVPINKTPSPDEVTITGEGNQLSVSQESLDGRYLAPYVFGRGLERDPNNSAIIRLKDTYPELSFKSNKLQITDSGVKFTKLEPLNANELLGTLNEGGSPRGLILSDIAAALRPYLTGEIDGVTLGVPVGTIIDFAGPDDSVPSNYLPCDGRELLIREYIELHSILKGTWGASISTFSLPNLNKRATIGAGENTISSLSSIDLKVGSYGGFETVRLAQKNLPSHIHGINFTIPAHNHSLTVNLPQFPGAYETGNIMVNGFNNYITIIGGTGPQSAPQTVPYGPVDELSNLRAEASQNILNNKEYIQKRVIDYVYTNYPWALTATPTIGDNIPLSAKCYRDTGFIVDSIAADLLNNANHRSVETGILYFSGFVTPLLQDSLNVKGPTTVFALPADQVNPTIQAIEAIASFITGIHLPSYQPNYTSSYVLTASKYYTDLQKVVINGLDNYTSVISNSAIVPQTTPAGQAPDSTFNSAATTILNNKSYLQQRVVEYVKYNFPNALAGNIELGPDALSAKCYRDTGFIIDSLAADLKNNTNHRSVETGVFYFSGALLSRQNNENTTVPTLPLDQVFATIQAISSIGSFTTGLTLPLEQNYTTFGILSTDEYYSNSQNIMLSGLNNFITVINDYNNVPVTTPMGYISAGDDTYLNTGNTIFYSKTALQLQVVQYVKLNFPLALSGVDTNEENALSAKCYRDTGFLVDALVADIKNNTNHRSVEAGLFYFNGAVLARQSNPGSSVPTLPENQVNATIAAISAIGKYINDPSGLTPFPPPITPIAGILPNANLTALSGKVNDLVNTMIYPLQNNGASVTYSPAGSATSDQIALGNLLQSNKTNIQKSVSAYVLEKDYLTFNPSLSAELTAKCNRDVGYMVDALSNDLKTGVNARSVQYAVAYWDGSTSRLPENIIPNQKANTIDTIKYLRSATLDVAVNASNSVSNTAFKKIKELISTMIYPLQNNGETVEYDPMGNPLSNSEEAVELIALNKEILQDSVSNYVASKGYLQPGSDLLAKCRRDVGFMVDSIINDIKTGVNAKSVQYALAYWDGSSSRLPESLIPNQRKNTIDSINFLKGRILGILPQEPGISSQIQELVDTMVYPLQNLGSKLPYKPVGAPITPDRSFAANLLQSNRENIRDRVIEYVRTLNIINDRPDLQAKCYRDLGYMVDSVINDLRFGTDAQSIQFGLAYWSGTINRIGGSVTGANSNVDQRSATIQTIKFLRDTCVNLLLANGGGSSNLVPISGNTGFNERIDFYGYTDDGGFAAEPFSNLQPSAVVNKIIKVK